MTTIQELIDLLIEAKDKLGGDMPVILEPNISHTDVNYGVFPANEVLYNIAQPLVLVKMEAQSNSEGFGYDDGESLTERKDVLCISSPAYIYGSKENKF